MKIDREELKKMHPKDIRALIRKQDFKEHTMGVAEGYAQANLAIIPKKQALEFMIFCQRNPKPCPVLEVTEPGVSKLKYLSDTADIKTDIGQYRVFKDGVCIDEPYDVTKYWRDDLICFLIGCSATFDHVLHSSGVEVRHFKEGYKVPSVFISKIECEPSGPFKGPMVVSERPIKIKQLNQVIQICSRYPLMHGTPVHVGNPKLIGVDMSKPDWGEKSDVLEDEIAAFWGCGVTPQTVAVNAKLDLLITHYPAMMFLSDRKNHEFAVIS